MIVSRNGECEGQAPHRYAQRAEKNYIAADAAYDEGPAPRAPRCDRVKQNCVLAALRHIRRWERRNSIPLGRPKGATHFRVIIQLSPNSSRCAASVASSAGNMLSRRNSCAAAVVGVPTVVIIEK